MSNYEALLNSLLPPFYWFRDGHFPAGQGQRVHGTIILGPNSAPDDVFSYVNGQPMSWSGPLQNDYAADKFWFVPEERRFAVTIEVPHVLDEYSVAMCLGIHDEPPPRQSFMQIKDWAKLPAPPLENIERVSGKGATAYSYHNNGLTDYYRFRSLAQDFGNPIQSGTDLLDWGCGCGRLTRHFIDDGAAVVGIDIDSINIQWCQDNLRGRFQTVPLLPPTSFQAETFDVIIANSVLSHLTESTARAWLDEIRRLLRPDGLALLSYHGEFSLAGVASKTEEYVQQVLNEGFNANLRATEVNDVIGDPEYYRHTFMTDEFARQLFSEHFEVLDQVSGVVSRFQNVAALRPR